MNSDKNLNPDYVKSYYDGFLSKYEKEYSYYRWQAGNVEKLHYFQTKRSLAPYLFKVKGSVLEVGGGDAIWTMEYIANAERLTFLDISEEMIARAKKRLSDFSDKISFVNVDFLKSDFQENSFDNIVSIRNLEYFTDKKLFVSKVGKLLKSGGSFVLVTKSPNYHGKDKAKEKTLHKGQINIIDLINLIESEGMKVKKVYPAIFGKLFRFSLMRAISNSLQWLILKMPWNKTLVKLLSYFSESFVIYVKK